MPSKRFSLFYTLICIGLILFTGCKGTVDTKEKLFEKGLIYENIRQFPKAINLYDQTLEKDPFYVIAYYRKGKCYQAMGNFSQALETYKKGYILDETDLDLTRSLAEIYYLTADYELSLSYCAKVQETIPTDTFTLNLLGKIYAAKAEFDQSINWLERAVDGEPENIAYIQDLIRILSSQKKNHKALSICERFLNTVKDPAEQLEIALLKADLLIQLDRLDESLTFLLELEKSKPDNPEVLSRIGRIYFTQKDPDKSLEYTDRVLEKSPNHLHTLLLRGTLLLQKERSKEALILFQSLARNYPNWPEVHLKLAAAYQAEGQWEQAKSSYQRLLQMVPGFAIAQLALANIYLRDGWHEETQKICEAVLEKDPQNVNALKIHAASFLLKKDYSKAISLYKKIMILSPESENNHAMMAELYLASRQLPKAFQAAQQALKANPDDQRMQLIIAIVLQTLKKPDQAQQILRNLLKKDPDYVAARFLLADIYMTKKLWSAAEEQYQKISEQQPENFEVLLRLGKIYGEKGEVEKAEKYFESLVEKFPEEERLYYEIGRFYAKQKRLDEAIEKFESVIERNPNHLFGNLLLANLYRQQNKLDQSEERLRNIIAVRPKLNLDNELMLLLIAQDKIIEASRHIQTLSVSRQRLLQVQLTKGFVQLLTQKLENALITFRKLHDRFPSALSVSLGSANAYMMLGYPKKGLVIIEDHFEEFPEVAQLYSAFIESLPKDQEKRTEILNNLHQFMLFAHFQWGLQYEEAFNRLPEELKENVLFQLIKVHAFRRSKKWDVALEILDNLVAQAPSYSYYHYQRALLLQNKEDNVSALREYFVALNLNPKSALIKLQLIRFLLKQGNERDAEKVAVLGIQKNPDNKDFYFLLSNFYAKQKKWAASVKLLEPIYKKDPTQKKAIIALARSYYELHRYQESADILKKLVEREPKNVIAHSLYLRALMAQQNFEEALYVIGDIQRQIPKLNVDLPLTLIYMEQQEFEKALRMAENVRPSTLVSGTNLFIMALTFQANQDYEEAKKYFLRAARVAKDKLLYILAYLSVQKELVSEEVFQKEAYEMLSETQGTKDYLAMLTQLEKNTENKEKALLDLNFFYFSILNSWDPMAYKEILQRLKTTPKNLFFYRTAFFLCKRNRWTQKMKDILEMQLKYYPNDEIVLLELGKIYLAQKEKEKALPYLNRVLKVNPETVEALVLLGMLYNESGDNEKATSMYEKVLAINANQIVALNNLAYIYSTHPPLNLERAAQMGEKALKINPRSGAVADTLGWIYYQQGRYAEALVHLEHAKKSIPQIPDVHYHLGKNYLALQDQAKAKEEFEFVLQIDPEGDFSQEAKELIESIQ